MGKKVSVVIVTYNSESLIFDCINSIFEYNDIGRDLEIIVVDNMSHNVDAIFDSILEKFGDRIVLIKNDRNGGYGQGNNVGIKAASSDIIMIMNPDVRLLCPVFDKVVKYFGDRSTAMVGMKQMVTPVKKGLSYSFKLSTGMFVGIFGTIAANKLNYYNPSSMYFSGSCFFIRRSLFIELGLFDEKMFMYGEENDLHHRLITFKKHLKMIYDPHLSYLHLSEDRVQTIKAWQQMLDSSLYFCDKYGFPRKAVIVRSLRSAYFFKFLSVLKNNTHNSNLYSEWIQILKNKRSL